MINSWLNDSRGAVAIEATLALPGLITLLVGTAYVVDAQHAKRSAQSASFLIGEYAASLKTIRDIDLNKYGAMASLIMQPYPASNTSIRLTSVGPNTDGKMAVQWSSVILNSNGALAPLPNGTVYTFPSGSSVFEDIRGPRTGFDPSIIITEVHYSFSSPLFELYNAFSLGSKLNEFLNVSAVTYTPSQHNTATQYVDSSVQ